MGACAYVIFRAELEHSGGFELGNLADRPGKVRLHRGPGRLQRSGRAHASQHRADRRDGEGGSENSGTRHRSKEGTTEGLWVRTGKGKQQGSQPEPESKAGDHRLRSYTCAFFSLLLSCFRCSAYLVMFFSLFKCNPYWIFSLILFMKENQFAKFVRCDVIKESCHSLVKIRFLFPSAALQRHQRLSVFSRSQENDDSFHFSSKPQSFGLFFHVFLFSLECLFNPHCILNKAPILDVYFKITSAEARSDGSRSGADASRSSSFPSSLKPESRCRHCKSNQGERKKGFSRRKRYVGRAKNTIRERLARPWQGKSS